MNFKTTIVLLLILVGVGGYFLFTRDKGEPTELTRKDATKLFDLTADQVQKVILEPADGKRIVLERQPADANLAAVGPAKSQWKIAEPVNTYADPTKAGEIVDAITGATSTAEVKAAGNASAYGLDQPQMKIEVDGNGKSEKFSVGRQVNVGNGLYVQVDGKDVADVIDADLLSKVDQTPETLRLTKLLDVNATAVRDVTIAKPDQTIELRKPAEKWTVAQPTTMPAESSAVTGLLGSLSDLSAIDYAPAGQNADQLVGQAQATVTLNSVSPATQPSTQPAPSGGQSVTVVFGQPDTVLEKNLWVKVTPGDIVAKVSKEALTALQKKPLDFRDLDVDRVNAADVTGVTITKVTPATTQPTTQPAKTAITEITKTPPAPPAPPPVMGPTLKKPTTVASTQGAATEPATATTATATATTTQPATAPAEPASAWRVAAAGAAQTDADDAKVNDLLAKFNPLRAEKYLESAPTTRPTATYTIDLVTGGTSGVPTTTHHVEVTDPADGSTPTAAYDGLTFEVSRTLIDSITADLAKKKQQ